MDGTSESKSKPSTSAMIPKFGPSPGSKYATTDATSKLTPAYRSPTRHWGTQVRQMPATLQRHPPNHRQPGVGTDREVWRQWRNHMAGALHPLRHLPARSVKGNQITNKMLPHGRPKEVSCRKGKRRSKTASTATPPLFPPCKKSLAGSKPFTDT